MQGQSILCTVISVVVSSKFSIIKVVTKPEYKMKEDDEEEEEDVRQCKPQASLIRPHNTLLGTNTTKGVIRRQAVRSKQFTCLYLWTWFNVSLSSS